MNRARGEKVSFSLLHLGLPLSTPTHRGHVGNAQDEADGIKDVTLSTTIETSDGIEAHIESRDVSSHGITASRGEVSALDLLPPPDRQLTS